MKLLFLIILSQVITSCSISKVAIHQRATASSSILLNGPETFIENVNRAFVELEALPPQYLKFIKEHVKIIEESNVSGMHVADSPTRLELSLISCPESNIKWCASVLYHEAWHVWLYRQKKAFSGKQAERFCNLKQLDLLKKMGAAESTIKHLKEVLANGDHSDLDGDGDYDQDDYDLRGW